MSHSVCLTEAVAAQLGQLFLSVKDARTKDAFAPHTGLQAVYALVLASIPFKKRVPASSTYALKRLANSLTRKKGGGMFVDKRGSIGLLEAFYVFINQQSYDAKFSCLTAAEAEQQLLLPWDA
eukprot:2742162-Pleurochrysis_carterae.AAC.1